MELPQPPDNPHAQRPFALIRLCCPYRLRYYNGGKVKNKNLTPSHSPFSEYKYVLTIPGFGPDVSGKVLGAIGDPNRFQNGKQVLKMGGLDFSADRSGKDSDKAIPEISKRGKADLRYALYQAALIASLKNRDIMIYYTNKLRGREREKGIYIKMR